MSSILNDIKQSFKDGSVLTKIIYINLGVFILVNLLGSLAFLLASNPPDIINWIAVPAYLPTLILKPWTLFSYMFVHQGFMHLLMNLIWLYFGGRIFQDLMGSQRLLSTYILGGLSGALLYIFSYNVLPVFSDVLPIARAMGASASVLAIIVAIATKVPNYSVHLIFIGPVKLKYIALFSVILDLISLNDGNAGGHIAHLGGAIFGFLYIRNMEKGRDWSVWFYKWVNTFKSIFKSTNKSKVKVVYRSNGSTKSSVQNKADQEIIDVILDKISKSGYDSLTLKEKDILFKASQKK